MRNFLTAVCLLAITTIVAAEPRTLNKPVVCDTTERVFRSLTETFKETIQWRGASPEQGTGIVLTVNLTTGSWTLIEYTTVMACIIAVGENSTGLWGIPI
jgi:hypothetical protein